MRKIYLHKRFDSFKNEVAQILKEDRDLILALKDL